MALQKFQLFFPVITCVPCMMKGQKHLVQRKTCFWVCFFDVVHDLGLVSSTHVKVFRECLGSWADFRDLWRASGCDERDELAQSHIPIIIHEDAVPHFSGTWRISQHFSENSIFEQRGKKTQFFTGYSRRICFLQTSTKAAQQLFGVGALGAFGVIRGKQSKRSQFWEPQR